MNSASDRGGFGARSAGGLSSLARIAPARALAAMFLLVAMSGCGGGGGGGTPSTQSVSLTGGSSSSNGFEGGSIVLKTLDGSLVTTTLTGSLSLPSGVLEVVTNPVNQVCTVLSASSVSCVNTPINDTGLTGCWSGAPCSAQDSASGRDALAARLGRVNTRMSNAQGFDYTRICNNGQPEGSASCSLTAGSTPGVGAGEWGCTRDNVTGLVWRVANYTGRYTFGDARAQTINFDNWCGIPRADWSLPSVDQLQSALYSAGEVSGKYRVAALRAWLPMFDFNARNQQESIAAARAADEQDGWQAVVRSGYWATTQLAGDQSMGWAVLFEGAGRVTYDSAVLPMLRIAPVSAISVPSRFSDPYYQTRWVADLGAGTLTDRRSGLMWMICSAVDGLIK